eukprot:comp20500_c0_seq1/m.26190 comp20500_c0_seq1/g.26190  ORF comp20500_c0_seq1/g.26190 comp20500_c0_seq1/m.26190 type:complete len:141 (-) comp20500_c0_seq1:2719-3141(-)
MQGAVSALCCSAEASENLQETIDQMCKFVCKGPIGEEEGFPGIQEAADRVKNFPNQRTIYNTVKNVYLPAECLAFMWAVALCLQTDLMGPMGLGEDMGQGERYGWQRGVATESGVLTCDASTHMTIHLYLSGTPSMPTQP